MGWPARGTVSAAIRGRLLPPQRRELVICMLEQWRVLAQLGKQRFLLFKQESPS